MSKRSGAWIPRSFDEAIKRAAGRRRYNHTRRIKAELRRAELIKYMFDENGVYGTQARAARLFGVSEATISRDMDVIMKGTIRCPHCGRCQFPPDEDDDDLYEEISEASEKGDLATR